MLNALLEYKCPCCGGAIGFDSSSQNLKCPYCDTEFEIETLKAYNDDISSDSYDSMNWKRDEQSQWIADESDGLSTYVCTSCGGEIVCDNTTAATSCPYCDNPVIMKGNLTGTLRPDLVIPFKLDKKAAKEKLAAFYKGKKLLPKSFADENHVDEIRGVYVPFWLFSCQTDAKIRYRATRMRSWSDARYHYTEASHYSVIREGSLDFRNVPVDGSTKMADDIMESIEPFDLSEAVDFETAYLAGYLADKYDLSSDECINRANVRIKNSTESTFAGTVQGYASVTPESSHVAFDGGEVKYGLLPVWLLNTTWQGKNYVFAMNGQTGKFIGDLPVDMGAFWKWFAIVFGIAFAVAFAFMMFFT